jgi:predicted dienelactone hydrolase
MAVFYPAAIGAAAPAEFKIAFAANVHLYRDADLALAGTQRPLVMLSHGRGSSAWDYAWFAQALASHGYIVAALNHYHANRYHSEVAYLANKIWQRPRDISLDITFLLQDAFWGRQIDPARIGIAGHSQGGFTALWAGGALINAEKFLAFQRIFINNDQIPPHIRAALPLDAGPALHVHDKRIRAVFAMAPGIVQVFGMDAEGLQHLTVPTYIVAGANDAQVPPEENAVFAAQHIPNAKLRIIPGAEHEIFTNECDQEGRNESPEACIDPPGVNRHAIHESIAATAVGFFDKAMGAGGTR